MRGITGLSVRCVWIKVGGNMSEVKKVVLNKCPFCGSDGARLMEVTTCHYAVACDSCGAYGPDMDSKSRAIGRWNNAADHVAEAVREVELDAMWLRRALVGLVGCDGKVDLEGMRMAFVAIQMPASEKAPMLEAIYALLLTLGKWGLLEGEGKVK